MTTLDSAAQGQEAALPVPDALSVFPPFSLSTHVYAKHAGSTQFLSKKCGG
jgi:hypothetical protein